MTELHIYDWKTSDLVEWLIDYDEGHACNGWPPEMEEPITELLEFDPVGDEQWTVVEHSCTPVLAYRNDIQVIIRPDELKSVKHTFDNRLAQIKTFMEEV